MPDLPPLLPMVAGAPTSRSCAAHGLALSKVKCNMSEVLPRLVLCVLAADNQFSVLKREISVAIPTLASGFEIDADFSSAAHDERMLRAFDVCWDRLPPSTHDASDEQAVAQHGGVIYVVSPHMQPGTHIEVCLRALALIEKMFALGASAVKSETAGNAHGKAHWLALAHSALAAHKEGDHLAVMRNCRLALTHRPLVSDGWIGSVGYHLVGLPEIAIDEDLGDQIPLTHAMDAIADYLAQHGIEATVAATEGEHEFSSSYEDDDFKFNPYGQIYCRALLNSPNGVDAAVPEKKKRFLGLF